MLSDEEISALLPWVVYLALIAEGQRVQNRRRQAERRGYGAPPVNRQKLDLAKGKALRHHRRR